MENGKRKTSDSVKRKMESGKWKKGKSRSIFNHESTRIGTKKSLTSYYNVRYNTSMSNKLKITTVGNSVGIVLPREILERLRVKKGDTLYALETPNGIELTAYDEEFARKLEVGKRVMRENRDLLRKLAE